MPAVIRTFEDFKADCAAEGYPEGFRPRGSDKTYYAFGWWEDGLQRWAEFNNRRSDQALRHFIQFLELRLDAFAAEYGEVRKQLHDQAALAAANPMCAQAPGAGCVEHLKFLRDRVILARRDWAAAKERFEGTNSGMQEQRRREVLATWDERGQQAADLLRQIESV